MSPPYIITLVIRMANGPPERLCAEVIVDTGSSAPGLDRPFIYHVPCEFAEKTQVGSLVLVPFSNRLAVGYVIGFPAEPPVLKLKNIARVLDEPPVFDFNKQRLCRWIASRYLSTLARSFNLVMPPGRSRRISQYISLAEPCDSDPALCEIPLSGLAGDIMDVLSAGPTEIELKKLKKHIGAGDLGGTLADLEKAGLIGRRFALCEPATKTKKMLVARLSDVTPGERLPERQHDIVDYLVRNGGAELQSELLRKTGTSHSSLKSLVGKGVVHVAEEEVAREPRLTSGGGSEKPPSPNRFQSAAIEEINEAVGAGRHRVFLLEGVTGSGKTEVYLRCIEAALGAGKRSIVLVPEIALTPQTLERFESRFPGEIAVLHSKLGSGERFDQWRAVREGRRKVVVGARSALFAPVEDLALIAIDEEHEFTYKSDKAPRYHAREVAEAWARMTGGVLVLGSATPSLESIEKARAGIYHHLVLPERIDNRPLPEIEVVDMKSVGGAGTIPLLSPRLLDALSRTVESGNQAILFLNRRGFANYMQCISCGKILSCGECEVSLCYHRKGHMLMCHHCGKTQGVPNRCPACGGGNLKTFGAGTQKVADEVAKHLPGVPFIRMDSDTTTTKDAHWRMLGDFKSGKAQILIGTQMIAKGLDIPGVTLVGVINADTALALPDFRASEKTFQLLTQVSGRAGRGLRPGQVIVQTYKPDHPAIVAVAGDRVPFIESELETRRQALYPPFSELVNILVSSTDLRAAARSAERLEKILESKLDSTGAAILGPAPSPLSRLRRRYRWHILIKAADVSSIGEEIRTAMESFREYARSFPVESRATVSMDVNPVSLL